jgi:hypothetical protein
MECLRTPYVVPWHPWRRRTRVRADGSVLSQVTSKRTLQCVQVTDAPAAIVRPSVRPFVRYCPRDNPASDAPRRFGNLNIFLILPKLLS